MKSRIDTTIFKRMVNTVYPAVGSIKQPAPLQCIRIELTEGGIIMTSNNLEASIKTVGEGKTESFGAVGVNGKSLHNIISYVSGPNVNISVVENGTTGRRLRVYCGGKRLHLDIIPDDSLPMAHNYSALTYRTSSDFFKGIDKVEHCMSDDETRRYLCGVCIQGNFMVATDGFALSRVPHFFPGDEIIMNRYGIDTIKKIFDNTKDVQICSDDSFLYLKQGDVAASCRLISGSYVRYNTVIPVSPYDELVIHKDILIKSLDMISTFSSEKPVARFALLDISEDKLIVTSSKREQGYRVEDEIECGYSGKPIKIAMNPTYLSNILKKVSSNKVIIEVRDEMKPLVIREGEHLQLIMPIRGQ